MASFGIPKPKEKEKKKKKKGRRCLQLQPCTLEYVVIKTKACSMMFRRSRFLLHESSIENDGGKTKERMKEKKDRVFFFSRIVGSSE